MINEILLTNENYVRSLTSIDNNVQSKYLLSAIREAQEIGLQNYIGSAMLSKLKTLIASGHIRDNENIHYKNLVNECQLYLAYQSIVNLCLVTAVKISNGGLQQTTDENLTALSIDDTFTIQKHYQDKADFFAKRLQNYILENKSNLPEISEANCNQIKATLNSAASTDLWLGGKRGKCSKRFPPYIGK